MDDDLDVNLIIINYKCANYIFHRWFGKEFEGNDWFGGDGYSNTTNHHTSTIHTKYNDQFSADNALRTGWCEWL
jgi:hypothetical protein